MVVSDEFAGQNPIQRWERVSPSWTALKAAAIISVTSAELLAMDRLILWDALQDGNPLFDRGVRREAAARFRRKKEAGEIVAIEGGWRVAEPPSRLSPGPSPPIAAGPLSQGSRVHRRVFTLVHGPGV